MPLLRFCLDHGYQLRFIEQMPLDAQHGWRRENMVTADEILDSLTAAGQADPGRPGGARLGARGDVPGRRRPGPGRRDRLGDPAVLRDLRPGPADRRRAGPQLPVRPGREQPARPAARRGQRRRAGRAAGGAPSRPSCPGTASTTPGSCSPPGRCPRSAADREGPVPAACAGPFDAVILAGGRSAAAGRGQARAGRRRQTLLGSVIAAARRPGRPGSSWSARNARPRCRGRRLSRAADRSPGRRRIRPPPARCRAAPRAGGGDRAGGRAARGRPAVPPAGHRPARCARALRSPARGRPGRPGVVLLDDAGRPQWLASGWDAAALRRMAGRYRGSSLGGLLGPAGRPAARLDRRPGEPPAWLDCDTPDELRLGPGPGRNGRHRGEHAGRLDRGGLPRAGPGPGHRGHHRPCWTWPGTSRTAWRAPPRRSPPTCWAWRWAGAPRRPEAAARITGLAAAWAAGRRSAHATHR